MKVLITGANGMLARAAAQYCRSVGDKVAARTRQELDISDQEEVNRLFESEKFDAVLNCAAYTNVDGAETEHERCLQTNIVGVGNLAAASKRKNCVFVTISTDYVFDGTKGDFYTQHDSPNPQGYYARTKYSGERAALRIYPRSIIVRSGWIFGHGGTNFLSVMHKLLSEGRSIKAISDSYGTPTFADDLAKRLRELAAVDQPGTYHVCNEGAGTTFAEFAEKICELKGYDPNLIERVSMDSLSRPAPRPRDSRLKCLFRQKLGLSPLQDWEKALAEFLNSTTFS